MQCRVRVCAALAAGSGVSGWYLVLCVSRSPLPAPRVPRCVWRAVPSGCPLPSLAGTPFHAVCAFRLLGQIALLVVPACPLRVCALALPRRPLPPPLGGVACAPRAVPALGAGRAAPRGPCPSACPALVSCSVWRAWGGGNPVAVPPSLAWGCGGGGRASPGGGAFHCCEGRLGSGAPPPPTAPPLGGPLGSAIHVLWARACGCGGPTLPSWPARPVGAACRRAGPGRSCAGGRAGGGGGGAPCPPFARPSWVCRARGRSASFRPSAFPGQATKLVLLASICPWGAWPPIPLQFVLARLHWARSVRRPGALAPVHLVSAVPVGAGGWGGGAGRAPAPLSGGGRGDHPPCLGGWAPGPPRLAGRWGGGGGGSRRGLPAPPLGGGPRFPILAPLVSLAHSPPACACGGGRGAAPGWGGMRGSPRTAPLGAPADLNPPSALPKWALVMGGSWGPRPPYCSDTPPCAAPKLGPRVAPARWCWLACRPRPPREQAAGGAGARGVQVKPHSPPPPRRGPFWGRGGAPSAPGGRGVAPVARKLGGGSGGGGGGGAAPPPPLPRRASACHPFSPACPPGVYSCRGGCLVAAGVRRGLVGRQRVSAAGGGGEGGGTPPLWFAPPSSPGRPLKGQLCLRRPGRRRSAAGRQRAGRAGACLGRGAPSPRVQRRLRGGCGGAVSSVCLRPLMGLRVRGGDPRAGPRWSPSFPPPSSCGAGRPGAAVRVSGQRLAGCGAVGSPPRSLSPPSSPREVPRAPSSRRTVGGAWVGGPSSPSRIPASAVCAVTCAAACVAAGAVAAAGCAGRSASGRGRCARPPGLSC